ncbi:peptidoglycan synthetase FtsI [Sanguibacter gelidistatuariae]|uniref:Peptidoglycan synthetase FtsI n=1 Tax=Sanguibacter gelidistatuariae TaxID=1814289 RepID=A0A1G6NX10_9MICO|nr:penicillin-binding protein 2 [Sanguibacter gelidistatuariae]SDC72482.1 peptidoglycan synthetase FtsI [Sanguibacter gelidistatuariae]
MTAVALRSGSGTLTSSRRPPRPPRPPKAAKPARTGNPNGRIRVLSIAVMVVLVLFTGRLIYVQAYLGPALAAEAQSLRIRTITIPAVRGQITDLDGNILATSVDRYNIFADQPLIAAWKHSVDGTIKGGPTEAARLLAPILELSAPELAAALNGEKNQHKTITMDVSQETWDAIRALKISGIFAESQPERSYPAGTTGGNIVGFTGQDGNGQSGLEYSLNDILSGSAGSTTYEGGRSGHVIPTGEQSSTEAVPGDDVTLTMIRDLQWMAKAALEEQITKMGGTGGFLVVTNIKTGAIYALADAGSIDPNNPTGFGGSQAISTIFDPGSTAKIVTMSALIETGLATPTDQFVVPDRYTTVNNQTFKDSHDHADANWTLTGILAESSNTGTVMVGQKLPQQVRHDYLTKFGFGSKTGVELAGEEKGLLAEADKWDGSTKYAVLFGQGFSVTALQATNVFATIANGGVRMTPHLVAGTTDAAGIFTPSVQPEGVRVVSESTADQVLKMTESAVLDGTGAGAEIAGYRVAGKTGTAQIPGPSGQLDGILSSFIGVAPADDPRIAVGVFIENPTASIYGGVVAAPVFSEVTAFALQKLGVVPSGTTPDLFPTTW